MLTAFRLVLLCLPFVLLSRPQSSSSESSSEEEFLCPQTGEAKQICKEMKRFFRSGWNEDRAFVADQSPGCRRCMTNAGPSYYGNPHLKAFMRQTRSIACQMSGRCKPKTALKRRHVWKPHSHGHLVGDKQCTQGPAYWCRSVRATEECGMHEYCGKRWSNQTLQSERHDARCIDCQRALAYLNFYGDQVAHGRLRGYRLDGLRNLSQAGVSPAVLCHYMDGRCEGKPVERELDGKECVWAHAIWLRTRQLYAQHVRDFHTIMDTLLDECFGDPVCQSTVIHVLPIFVSKYGEYLAAREDHTGETPCVDIGLCHPNLANKIYCDVCLTFMASVKRALQHNGSIEFVRKMARSVCPLFGSKRKDCEDYIDQNVEQWVDNVDEKVNPVKICEDMKLCAKKESPEESDACERCEKFVTRMRMKAICPVKKFFNFFLVQFCRIFGPLENKCVVEVDSMKDSIVGLINAILKASTICSPFCKDGAPPEAEFSSEWVWNQAAKGVCSLDKDCQERTAELLKDVFAWLDREEKAEGGTRSFCLESKETMCKVCKSINADVATANPEEMRRICADQPSSMREACDLFVDKYQWQIVDLLPRLSKKGDAELCQRLGVCGTDDNCMICALMSRELRTRLPPTLTEDTVKTALHNICDGFTESYGDGCQRFLSNFEKSIIALMVKKGETARTLCRSLGVCYLNPDAVSLSTCEICRFTVEAIERAVTTNATEEQIMEWASRACDSLPGSYKEKCRDIIRTDLPKILEFLNSLIDANLVCMKLGLCGPNATHCQLSETVHSLSSYCPLCEIVLESLRPVMDNSPLARMMRIYFQEACISQLPEKYHDDCKADPFKHLCKIIKICPLNSGQVAAAAA